MKKTALITGSSDRIGKALSLALAKKGYNLILHYNTSQDKAETLKRKVMQFNVEAELVQWNFMDNLDYDAIFSTFKSKNIEIELLINCASDFVPSSFKDVGSELLSQQLQINFKNAYLLTKAFARVYKKGEIINLLDTKTEKNYTSHLDYLLSKKLLREFTQLAAVELAPHFRVNAISPGLVLPPKGKDEKYLLNLSKDIPLKKIGSLEDIVKALHFLLESKFITGQILYIDGGDHLI